MKQPLSNQQSRSQFLSPLIPRPLSALRSLLVLLLLLLLLCDSVQAALGIEPGLDLLLLMLRLLGDPVQAALGIEPSGALLLLLLPGHCLLLLL